MLAIFLDIETTGLDAKKHVPIDIAFQIVDVHTSQVVCQYQSIIKPSMDAWMRKDPTSMTVNGFSWEDLKDGKDPVQVGEEIIETCQQAGVKRGRAVFICQNPAFDRGFFTQLVDVYTQEKLNWPYHWLDFASMYWALFSYKTAMDGIPFPQEMCLSKNSIAEEYDLPIEASPHRAMGGVEHLILCYKRVVGMNSHLEAVL